MPKGKDPGQTGAKKGYVGIDDRHNSDITDNVFSKDWASPLNADNAKQPGPHPNQGGVLEADKMGEIPNPLRIPNVGGRK